MVYGDPEPLVVGKILRKSPARHKTGRADDLIDVLPEIYHTVEIYVDIFFVNGMDFLIPKASGIGYLSGQEIYSRYLEEILDAIILVKEKYINRGFKIGKWYVDNEFNTQEVSSAVLPSMLEVYGRNEYVGVIERTVRPIKKEQGHQYMA